MKGKERFCMKRIVLNKYKRLSPNDLRDKIIEIEKRLIKIEKQFYEV